MAVTHWFDPPGGVPSPATSHPVFAAAVPAWYHDITDPRSPFGSPEGIGMLRRVEVWYTDGGGDGLSGLRDETGAASGVPREVWLGSDGNIQAWLNADETGQAGLRELATRMMAMAMAQFKITGAVHPGMERAGGRAAWVKVVLRDWDDHRRGEEVADEIPEDIASYLRILRHAPEPGSTLGHRPSLLPDDWVGLCRTMNAEELKRILQVRNVDATLWGSRTEAHMFPETPLEVLRWLVETRGADLDRCHEQPTSAFHEAIVVGATTRLRELVELGADTNMEGEANPLAIACRERRPEVVATLLDLGADPDPSGVSPSPLVECLAGATRDLPATLAITRTLLDAGMPVTREARAALTRSGGAFEFHRGLLRPGLLAACLPRLEVAEDALGQLNRLLGVAPDPTWEERIWENREETLGGPDCDQLDHLAELLCSGRPGDPNPLEDLLSHVSDLCLIVRHGGDWVRQQWLWVKRILAILGSGTPLGPDQLTEARAVAWELVERPEGMERLVSLTLEWVLRNPVTACR